MRFNPPPGWPVPPDSWVPPSGWKPDPSWPAPPENWCLWLSDEQPDADQSDAVDDTPGSVTVPVDDDPAPAPDSLQGAVDVAPLLARIADLEAALRQRGDDVVSLDDQRMLQDVGIYRYHHPLANATAYKERLCAIEAQIDELVKHRRAILAADMFTFDGSLARGRKMVGDFSKLMLRAYNAEADNIIRSLRSGSITTAKSRLERSAAAIQKLGTLMEIRINPDYHTLRLTELELTADYQMKAQEQREQAREERQVLREQRRVEAELAIERERLEKERAHYTSVLDALRAKGDQTAAEELTTRLADIEQAIEANDYRAANSRAGYVYVISNIGAFGPNMVKIGMTRRLEPYDRVRELGDASVPFGYDVHALFFSDDAVALESELHSAFADRRVNFVNQRREFFFATPAEVQQMLSEKVGELLEFVEEPEATEYFQSLNRWPEFDTPARPVVAPHP